MIRSLQCTLSVDYGTNSKIFILPVSSIPQSWINTTDTWISSNQTELVYLLVVKGDFAQNEEKIEPVLTDLQPIILDHSIK